MKSPCLNCNDRTLGCHSKCKKYQMYRSKRNLINNLRAEYRKIEDYFYG